MKKFIKNLAVASLAIAGILVSSCKVEDISTTFEATKAVATITVTALNALDGNADITNDPNLKLTASSTANTVISINGNVLTIEGGPALQAQTVTISGEYKGNEGKTTVSVNSLLAGGQASYAATVVVGTAPVAVATATVQVSVWDNVSGKDVTKEATYSYSGVPSGYTVDETKGSYIITCKDGISAFNFEVTATYGGNSNKATVAIGNIAQADTKAYAASIAVGTTPEPVKTPAVAKIHVAVVDGTLQKDITSESTITARFLDDGAEAPKATISVDGNVVTITAGESLKIDAATVLINAKYKEFEGDTDIEITEVPEGAVADKYTATVIIKNPAKYFPEKVSEEVTKVDVGTFFSTHGLHTYTHDYSHATTGHGHGTGEWLYNESEFILNTTVDFENEYGTIGSSTKFAPGCTATDMKMVVYYGEALYGKKAVKEPAQLKIKVSAFAMYSAFCTKTHTSTTYNIIRREEGKDDVLVGTVKVLTIATQAEYCEAAIPGHDGHYHYGHGHDDIHGYSSNAGGGIIFAE